MSALTTLDPNDPEHWPCPEGGLHRLVIDGPMHHRVMRCAWCHLSESTLRAAKKKEAEA